VPEIEDLGIDLKELGSNLYPGGESEALSRLELYMKKQVYIKFLKFGKGPYL